MAPGGPRKPLKRLDTDKGIKVNSKENPDHSKDFPTIFQGNQRISKECERAWRVSSRHEHRRALELTRPQVVERLVGFVERV